MKDHGHNEDVVFQTSEMIRAAMEKALPMLTRNNGARPQELTDYKYPPRTAAEARVTPAANEAPPAQPEESQEDGPLKWLM